MQRRYQLFTPGRLHRQASLQQRWNFYLQTALHRPLCNTAPHRVKAPPQGTPGTAFSLNLLLAAFCKLKRIQALISLF